jgi:hypothetical protein
LGIDDIDRLINNLLAGLQGLFERAMPLANAGAKNIAAGLTDCLLTQHARNLLRRSIERGYSPSQIDGEHPIGNRIANYRPDFLLS